MIEVHRGLGHVRPWLTFEADRLDRLAADLRAIAAGHGPGPEELEAAPVVGQWCFATRPVEVLVGTVDGHPVLADGPVISTEVWAIDLERRWARTLSRFYVLGDAMERGHGQD